MVSTGVGEKSLPGRRAQLKLVVSTFGPSALSWPGERDWLPEEWSQHVCLGEDFADLKCPVASGCIDEVHYYHVLLVVKSFI